MNLCCLSLCKALLMATVALAGASCISWTGDLPDFDPDKFQASEHPRALTFEVVYRSNGETKSPRADKAAEVLKKALEETRLFASVQSTATRGDLHIAFEIDETYNEGAVFASSFISGFTFLIIPGYAKAKYALAGTLYDGGSSRSARFEDDMYLLMQILLLPATPFFWPPGVENDVLKNLSLHTVHELVGLPQAGS